MKSKGGNKEEKPSRMVNNPARRVLGPGERRQQSVSLGGSETEAVIDGRMQGRMLERAQESFPDRAPRRVPLMQHDWKSQDVILGWREGIREMNQRGNMRCRTGDRSHRGSLCSKLESLRKQTESSDQEDFTL